MVGPLSASAAAHAALLGLVWYAHAVAQTDSLLPSRIVLVDLAPTVSSAATVLGTPAGTGPPSANPGTTGGDAQPDASAAMAVEEVRLPDENRPTAQLEAEYRQQLDALQQATSRLGDQVASLSADNAALAARQRSAQARIEELEHELRELRRAEQEALQETRAAYEQIVQVLRGEIADQAVALRQAQERLTVSIVDRVLFPSGQATLTPEGARLIDKVGAALASVSDRQFVIEGHTDDIPIGPELRSRFATNWELSAARATEVVNRLIGEAGISPGRLRAVGLADTRPVASNDTEEGRRLNRRIEVIVLSSHRS